MKKYLRLFLINLFAIWLVATNIEGVAYSGGWQTLALTALTLTVFNLLLKPLVKILLLPINLITLGAFRWLINVLTLYLVTLAIPQFTVKAFLFPGTNYQGFSIPAINLNVFWVLVLASFIISLTTSLILWVAKNS